MSPICRMPVSYNTNEFSASSYLGSSNNYVTLLICKHRGLTRNGYKKEGAKNK